MKQVLRRIAIHGAFTAVLLAVIGFMLAYMASILLASSPGPRAVPGAATEATDSLNSNNTIASDLRKRVPLTMAIMGFAFVAIAELALHFWKSRKPATQPVPAAPQSDPAEKLLEEILTKVEAERQETGDRKQETENKTGDRKQETGDKKQETERPQTELSAEQSPKGP